MPRCKHCKEKYEQYEFNNKYCKEIDCQTQKALSKLSKIKKQEQKDWNQKKREIKKTLKTKSDYEKDLERIFNQFIRERDYDLQCVSCSAESGTYKLTAGHFFPAGSYKNVRFNEDNVHGQCWFNCNKNRHGNLQEYRPQLILRIGQERFDELERYAREPRHYSIPELIILKQEYKEKIRKLKQKEN